jgi:ubiquinone/menaquinone biosynthesis C-methylase UbiE
VEQLLAGLKAAAEMTRLRLLFVLSHGELNVSELTFILKQSQPRVSRHLKVLAGAGLVSKHKEGNWVLFRLNENASGGAMSRTIVGMIPASQDIFQDDLKRYRDVRRASAEMASQYFAENAANWQKLRAYHIDETEVEAVVLALTQNRPIETLVDLGTGTGRMLEIFSPLAKNLIGLDMSHEMLAIARTTIEQRGIRNAQTRLADIYALPLKSESADLVLIHQVLHFLDDPMKALHEAKRILKPGGQLLVVDFAPHEFEELRTQHAHRRLGISQHQMNEWQTAAGLEQVVVKTLPPPSKAPKQGLTVSLWLTQYPLNRALKPNTKGLAA